jgi:hypothetical protein
MAAFDGAPLAKDLLRATRAGALATLDRETGFPFASLVTVGTDHDGAPLLLLSRLSAHTLNLEQDPRASLLLAQSGKGDPLAHPRLTVTGRTQRSTDPRIRSRFLARHPKAGLYAGFADFSFWRLVPAAAHLNGGFARAMTLDPAQLLTDLEGAQALLDGEEAVLERLNTHDRETLARLAEPEGSPKASWRATGLDPEGLDLAAGDLTRRIPFPERVLTPAALPNLLRGLIELAGPEPTASAGA